MSSGMLRGLSVEFCSSGDPDLDTQSDHSGVQVRAVCAHEPEAILKPNDLTPPTTR